MKTLIATFVLLIIPSATCYHWVDGPVAKNRTKDFHCPGLYCGRSDLNESFYSGKFLNSARMYLSHTWIFFPECGKCARGWRVSKNQTHSICEECSEQPELYDRFFLIFHVVLVLVLHWMAIDLTAKKRCLTQAVLTLHVCSSGEVALAASVTLLLTEPIGTFYL